MKRFPEILFVLCYIFSVISAKIVPENDSRNRVEGKSQSEWNESIKFPSVREFMNRKRPFTINVEGIVGTGKSTLLEQMRQYPYFDVLPEPVDKWTNLNGSDLLGLVFQDPSRWSMPQESYVLLTIIEEHVRNEGIVKIMERSAHSARYCFCEQFYLAGQMSRVEYDILDGWYNFMKGEVDLRSDLTIYLRVDPKKVYERIVSRGRQEEKTLSMDFLARLHRLHEDWLFYKNTSYPTPSENVIVIDTNRPLETMKEIYRDLAKKIWNSIPKKLKTLYYEKRALN